MPGRLDYQERKQKRIENYEEKAERNSIASKERARKGSQILEAMNG